MSASEADSLVAATRRQLRKTFPQHADDEGFLRLRSFVMDLGPSSELFCQDLVEFHQQRVDPRSGGSGSLCSAS